MSASPAEGVAVLNTEYTATFICGNSASGFEESSSGCFDVSATLTDTTTGSRSDFLAASCGDVAASASLPHVDCTSEANPLCPAGYLPSTAVTTCAPCPADFAYLPGDSLCHAMPVGGICPAGSNAMVNASGSAVDCTEQRLVPSPVLQNEVNVTLRSPVPHAFSIDFTGYVGTSIPGTCPPGTVPVAHVNLTPARVVPARIPVFGPACRFVVSVRTTFLEVSKLEIVPVSACGGITPSEPVIPHGGDSCLFRVRATGTVLVQTGVDCSNDPSGTQQIEPTQTPESEADGEALDEVQESSQHELEEAPGEDSAARFSASRQSYQCQNGNLLLTTGVPNLPVTLTAENGIFPHDGNACVPEGTQIPSPTPTPTGTNVAAAAPPADQLGTPTAQLSSTPMPTATFAGAQDLPPPFCYLLGSAVTEVTTNSSGVAGSNPRDIEVAGMLMGISDAAQPVAGGRFGDSVLVRGRIFVDDAPLSNAEMFSVFDVPDPVQRLKCMPNPASTDMDGRAACIQSNVVDQYQGVDVRPVDLIFQHLDSNGYIACMARTYVVRDTVDNSPPTVPPSQVNHCASTSGGIAVVRQQAGQLTVTASYQPTGDAYRSVTSGPVLLGEFPAATPVVWAGENPTTPPATSAPTVAINPVATATNTPPPTPIPPPTLMPPSTKVPTVPTPTRRATPTPVPTPTHVSGLQFSLDAARVSYPHNPGDGKGLNSVQTGHSLWLMMYFTVKSLPQRTRRETIYTISSGRKVVFRVSFSQNMGPSDIGRFIRYTTMMVPRTMSLGPYVFQAVLRLGAQTKSRTWKFQVVKRPAVARVRMRRGAKNWSIRVLDAVPPDPDGSLPQPYYGHVTFVKHSARVS